MSREVKRLGLYLDSSFRRGTVDGRPRLYRGSGDFGFLHFAAAVGARFERFAVIARSTDDATETPNLLPAGIELVPLPHYRSLRDLGSVAKAMPGTLAAMWKSLADLDAVWMEADHPFALALAVMAGLRRRGVILLIRQDTRGYFLNRVGARVRPLVVAPVWLLDRTVRLLARRLRTTVIGVASRYGRPRPNVLPIRVNLLAESQLAAHSPEADWSDLVELLTVGRIDREKNPLLVAHVLAALAESDGRSFRLTWVGDGPMSGDLMAEAKMLGVADRIVLTGFIPFGPRLLERYRDADAFIHVSLTEGLPQVLYEAMGSGLPIVATDVGGVRAALEGGRAGLVVAPSDQDALVEAIERLASEPDLRRRLGTRALELAREVTIESESARVAAFIRGGLDV
jgi:glycosyltransferase involved in cell wall biosynthesis